jgi:hypothetical protein
VGRLTVRIEKDPMSLADTFTCTVLLDGGPAVGKAELVGWLLTLLNPVPIETGSFRWGRQG